MRGYADGRIFLLHTNEQVPMAAFLLLQEANRIMAEMKAVNIECYVRELTCYGTEVQTVFALMYGKEIKELSLAFTSFKPAKIMCQQLNDTNPVYQVSALSFFGVMRNQTIGKYKLKYATPPANNEDVAIAEASAPGGLFG